MGIQDDKVNILLVDDQPARLLAYEAILEELGENLVSARSGEEALKRIREKRPDVVMMDINMPGIGGLETTRKLHQQYPDLPVIIVTVHNDDPFPTGRSGRPRIPCSCASHRCSWSSSGVA